MFVDPALRLGHTTAVDDASVIELVADDQVSLINKRKNRARVRCVTRLKRDRRFSPSIIGENLLELQVNIHGPGDDSYRPRPGTILSCSSDRGLFQLRMIGQTEIIVGA